MANPLHYVAYDDDIFCLDTYFHRPRLAACYLVREGDQAALIDTGTTRSVHFVLELLERLGLQPEQVRYLIPTHVHLDHAAAAGELMQLLPNAQLVVHPSGARHLIDPAKLIASATLVYGEEKFRHDYGELVPVPAERVIEAADGFTLDLNGRRLICLDTPGHARHHICIFDERSRGFFTGDTFGICYPELNGTAGSFALLPTTPIQFDPDAWRITLERLLAYGPERLFLTHFGEVTDPPAIARQLHHWIEASEQLAAQLGETATVEQLREGLHTLYSQQLDAAGVPLSPGEAMDLLDLELDLNSQGLAVWMQRSRQSP